MGHAPLRLSPFRCNRSFRPYRSRICSMDTFRLSVSKPTDFSWVFIKVLSKMQRGERVLSSSRVLSLFPSVLRNGNAAVKHHYFRLELPLAIDFITGRVDSPFQFDVQPFPVGYELALQFLGWVEHDARHETNAFVLVTVVDAAAGLDSEHQHLLLSAFDDCVPCQAPGYRTDVHVFSSCSLLF